MSFELYNAPSTFMRVMNQLLQLFIGKFVKVYFDDILIYNQTWEQYTDHLRQVFHTLQAEKFYAKLKKHAFYTYIVIFLGLVVSSEGVPTDPEKVKIIFEQPQPRTIRKLRSFHELATFYHRFIKNLVLSWHQYRLLKHEEFQWTSTTSKAFKEVKGR